MTLRKCITMLSASSVSVALGSAAYAAPPRTVAAGSTMSGAVAYAATTIGTSPQVHFNVPAIGFTCTNSNVAGEIQLGASSSGQIGTITHSEFNGCSWILSLAMGITQLGQWEIMATGDTVDGTTPVEMTNIIATMSDHKFCTFDVAGAIAGNFDNSNQHLAITGPSTLQVVGAVSGCFGLIHSGDPMTFTATYNLSNNVGPISITG